MLNNLKDELVTCNALVDTAPKNYRRAYIALGISAYGVYGYTTYRIVRGLIILAKTK
jgi:hypothetical protein